MRDVNQAPSLASLVDYMSPLKMYFCVFILISLSSILPKSLTLYPRTSVEALTDTVECKPQAWGQHIIPTP